ncbi:glycerophosphodiester phosphodiesterase family protein [Aurantiacibacter gangjinensis]|uniref:Uncharacterized protein n=1 Tax=Aurantiacibacter gangjinensis TaxID=502682 RepID=A0A0G9MQX0_9SPHN|nr:glycerophosphodiester phosphodiesterase family protein [Aurantiacibacter gangjinensis]APE27678.1 Glycerophosphoryl diester phosphodiesterase [Aurantiacibacter gangjinensis]KLE31693.1 hypothetical protein AAW01_09240 [Aurantiacibacter gangjinensis]
MADSGLAQALAGWAYAHRGLHDDARPENSLAAFSAAMERGLGIECDIRKSSDGRAMVFHDAGLARLTGRSGSMGARPVGDLTAMTLLGSKETIPTLRDVLNLVGGQVPLLLEVKMDDGRPVDPLCRAIRRDLDGYGGAVGVMSFDKRVPAWFAAREPDLPRGLVITDQGSRTLAAKFRRRAALRRADPHFLALDVRDLPNRFARKQAAEGRMLFSWTVNSAEHFHTVTEAGAWPIMEGAGVAAWDAAS